jgi:hypothetical protein
MTALFISKVTTYGPRLMKDFGLTAEECAAIFGNLGHESAGFAVLQEQGKRHGTGGWGWAQWTGPRRRSFDAFALSHKLSKDSDEANYEYLCFELRGLERGALTSLKRAVGLENKVRAFERGFERAGIPAIPSRVVWGRLALTVLNHLSGKGPAPEAKAPALPRKASRPRPVGGRVTPRTHHHRHRRG